MLTLTALYVAAVVLLAGVVQTITGFGFALVAAPLLTLAITAKEAVLFILFIGIVVKGYAIAKTWHEGKFARILLLFAASAAGALPGAYVLRTVSDDALKILIGLALMAATLAMYSEYTVHIRRHRLAQSLVGLASGFLGATTSLSGPPVVLYMINEGQDKTTIRADLARYFFLGNATTLVIAGFTGTSLTGELVWYAAASLPAVVLGWWLGQKIFLHVDAGLFRRIALAVISLSGLVTLGAGLWPLVRGLLGHG